MSDTEWLAAIRRKFEGGCNVTVEQMYYELGNREPPFACPVCAPLRYLLKRALAKERPTGTGSPPEENVHKERCAHEVPVGQYCDKCKGYVTDYGVSWVPR